MKPAQHAGRPLSPSFYARPAEQVARELLGARLVSTVGGRVVAGRIVETEAYVGPHDDASHAAARIGRTRRNASMFGAPGIAYVYRSYGVHWCLNTVTDEEEFPAAVLIRALEPLEGLDVMRERRALHGAAPPDFQLCSGPGRLTAALGITGALDGHALSGEPLFVLQERNYADAEIVAGPRIGITRAAELPLRFTVKGSRWVSRGMRRVPA